GGERGDGRGRGSGGGVGEVRGYGLGRRRIGDRGARQGQTPLESRRRDQNTPGGETVPLSSGCFPISAGERKVRPGAAMSCFEYISRVTAENLCLDRSR